MITEAFQFATLASRSNSGMPTNKNCPKNINHLKDLIKLYGAETGNKTPSVFIHCWSECKGLIGDLEIEFIDRSLLVISDKDWRITHPVEGGAAK